MRSLAKWVAALSFLSLLWSALTQAETKSNSKTVLAVRRCPPDMVRRGGYCIDRYEVSLVDRKTREPLSPYYPPDPKLLAFVYDYWSSESRFVGTSEARRFPLPPVPAVMRGNFEPSATSTKGALPNGYLTHRTAKLSCENAGKRLCSEDEWVSACRSERDTKHPYGATFEPGVCNVFRAIHPAEVLHGNASLGHLDPRLHLVLEEGKWPLLEATGERPKCASKFGHDAVYDMEGNLDEWIDDPKGTFVGGFYSRSTREGCAAKVENHAPEYTDYSLGTRCCRDL